MGYRQVTLNGAIKKKNSAWKARRKEWFIYQNLEIMSIFFYGNSILMKREKISNPPKNYKVMKRFPEGHPTQHAPIPGRQYNRIKAKTNRLGEKVHLPGLLQ